MDPNDYFVMVDRVVDKLDEWSENDPSWNTLLKESARDYSETVAGKLGLNARFFFRPHPEDIVKLLALDGPHGHTMFKAMLARHA